MERNKEIRARCSAQEKAALDLMAAMDGVSPTEWIRESVRNQAKSRQLWNKPISLESYNHLFTVCGDREQFTAWVRSDGDIGNENTVDAWDNYYEQFTTDGDAADLRATQQDALR